MNHETIAASTINEDIAYDSRLENLLSEEEFRTAISQINAAINKRRLTTGELVACMCCGLCTLGVSCCIAHVKIRNAYNDQKQALDDLNAKYSQRGIAFRFRMRHYGEVGKNTFMLIYLPV